MFFYPGFYSLENFQCMLLAPVAVKNIKQKRYNQQIICYIIRNNCRAFAQKLYNYYADGGERK